MRFDHTHPLWDLYVRFHLGDIKDTERQYAKALLLDIHYGSSWDTRDAEQHVLMEKQRRQSL